MEKFKIKFKKLVENAEIPHQAHNTDVGFDLKAVRCEYDEKTDTYIYYTGLCCETETNDKYTHSVFAFPRSSNCKTDCYLTNHVGIIDSDGYRGEIQARFKNRTSLQTMIMNAFLIRSSKAIGKIDDTTDYIASLTKIIEEYTERAKMLEFAPYKVGDRIVQLVFMQVPKVEIEEVNEVNETERGSGGFGSTGK